MDSHPSLHQLQSMRSNTTNYSTTISVTSASDDEDEQSTLGFDVEKGAIAGNHDGANLHDNPLREWALQYEIREGWLRYLHALKDYKIVILCDDSGSMKTAISDMPHTRWDELRSIVKIVLGITTAIRTDAIDVFFLNRPSALNVSSVQEIDHLFADPPRGYTPIVKALRCIFELHANQATNDKKLLIFIATDGAPTNEKGDVNVAELEKLLNEERRAETTHVMFLLCTDDPACMTYLAEWDEKMVNVDVTSDYKTERETIRRHHGATYPFSIGDYIVKALLGAIDPRFDYLNESKKAGVTRPYLIMN